MPRDVVCIRLQGTFQGAAGVGRSQTAVPRMVRGRKIWMPSVLVQFSIRLSSPAVCTSSRSVSVNTGMSHDLCIARPNQISAAQTLPSVALGPCHERSSRAQG